MPYVVSQESTFPGQCNNFYINICNLFISRVSAYADQNHKLCLSAHECLPIWDTTAFHFLHIHSIHHMYDMSMRLQCSEALA